MSTFISRAVFKMVALCTITPRSITCQPLHARITPTMFLPMSCTSPFTVASSTFFASALVEPITCAAFRSSRNGSR
jgi:hypothetical protein